MVYIKAALFCSFLFLLFDCLERVAESFVADLPLDDPVCLLFTKMMMDGWMDTTHRSGVVRYHWEGRGATGCSCRGRIGYHGSRQHAACGWKFRDRRTKGPRIEEVSVFIFELNRSVT